MSEQFKYWAFISYSHQDKAWGDWLHKALETYRVPKRLVGRASRDGAVPKRLYPIFRDREELPTSSDLGSNINESLKASRYLIVICSPKSAVSRWVNEELKAFKAMGREDRILCVIVDGEPNASDKPNSGLLECFPEAVRYRVDASGQVTQERTEPIAADARGGKDGKADARLKIIAGLIGVGYDELKQREKQRQRIRALQITAAACVAAVALGFWSREQSRTALIERYTELGRNELLTGKPEFAAAYLDEAYSLGGTNPALRFLLAQSISKIAGDGPVFHGLSGPIHTAKISPDGMSVLVAARDSRARLWKLSPGADAEFKGHSQPISYAALSADGLRVATASDDGTARIWRSQDGVILQILREHQGLVNSAVFDEAGRRLITAGQDGTARIWDADTGKRLTTLKAGAPVYFALFSRDGRKAFAATVDNSIHVWNIDRPAPERTIRGYWGWPSLDVVGQGHKLVAGLGPRGQPWIVDTTTGEQVDYLPNRRGGPHGILSSPDGKLLLSADVESSASLWDLVSGRRVARLRGHKAPLNVVTFSRDGTRVLTAGRDKLAMVWTVPDGKRLVSFGGHSGIIYGAAFSPEGNRVATGDDLGKVMIWDATTGKTLAALDQHKAAVRAVDFSRNGRQVSTAGEDGFALLINVGPGDAFADLEGALSEDTFRLVFSPDSRYVAGPEQGGTTAIWDARTGSRLASLAGELGYSNVQCFSPEGERVLTLGADRTATIWSLNTGHPLVLLAGHSDNLRSASFSEDGARVVTASDDGSARVWDAHTGKQLLLLAPRGDVVYDAQFFARSKFIITATKDNVARIWDAGTGALVSSFQGSAFPNNAMAFASGTGRILVPMSKWDLKVLDVLSSKSISVLKTGEVSVGEAAFSPDGNRLVTTADLFDLSKVAAIWDANNGRLLTLLQGHSERVGHAAFGPDGRRIVTTSDDGTAKIWDSESGKLLATLEGHSSRYAAFSPDNARLVTLADGVARTWNVELVHADPKTVSQRLRCRVTLRVSKGQLLPARSDPSACPKPASVK